MDLGFSEEQFPKPARIQRRGKFYTTRRWTLRVPHPSSQSRQETPGFFASPASAKRTATTRMHYKVVMRPGGGLDLTQQSLALLRDCVLRAAKVQPDIAGEDTLRINMRQNTMIMSTPSLANVKEYRNIKEIMIDDKSYTTAAYVKAPENTSKGVIHGIPKYDNQEDIEKNGSISTE
ncbi:hypothetical protein HPB51_013165 [Rhipicephalus microplus]|uniref:Uncharacterized protein n=1 Tax=Rhipicephalus microplus TaxID=6941 RepID=A0A9J6E1J0_RHIMP|nr:hypothetical protein HPB51_013165 [Rhipicephalus microplus]